MTFDDFCMRSRSATPHRNQTRRRSGESMFPTKESLAQSKILHKLAAELRGKFLNKSAWIETLLGDILASYFCSDVNRRVLFSEVANDMRSSTKAALLEKILQHSFPQLREAHPRLKKRLDSLRTFRNRLAHSHIDTSEDALAAKKFDEVTFVFYEDEEMKRQCVTRADAKRRATEANQLQNDLLDIQRAVRGSQRAGRCDD